MVAAANGHELVVRDLLANGFVQLNAVDKRMRMAVDYAQAAGQHMIVSMLSPPHLKPVGPSIRASPSTPYIHSHAPQRGAALLPCTSSTLPGQSALPSSNVPMSPNYSDVCPGHERAQMEPNLDTVNTYKAERPR